MDRTSPGSIERSNENCNPEFKTFCLSTNSTEIKTETAMVVYSRNSWNYMRRITGILDEGKGKAPIVKDPRRCAFITRY
jgi:hypothetical protein